MRSAPAAPPPTATPVQAAPVQATAAVKHAVIERKVEAAREAGDGPDLLKSDAKQE